MSRGCFISKKERAYIDFIFNDLFDGKMEDGEQVLGSDQIFSLFKSSDLVSAELSMSWKENVAQKTQKWMNREEFSGALKFIASGQTNGSLIGVNQAIKSELPLAKFKNEGYEAERIRLDSEFDAGDIPVFGESLDCDSQIRITDTQVVSEGYWGMSSYTQYKVESRLKGVPGLNSGSVYSVWRRFSDFKTLHTSI